jgi:cadmium resistance protein CadD (predicted permease)
LFYSDENLRKKYTRIICGVIIGTVIVIAVAVPVTVIMLKKDNKKTETTTTTKEITRSNQTSSARNG